MAGQRFVVQYLKRCSKGWLSSNGKTTVCGTVNEGPIPSSHPFEHLLSSGSPARHADASHAGGDSLPVRLWRIVTPDAEFYKLKNPPQLEGFIISYLSQEPSV